MRDQKLKVLFVCLGNICRSPLAEGVFRHQVERAKLAARFVIDSAGTSAYHAGDAPDERTTAVALSRGIVLSGQSRQIQAADLRTFDYVLVMDTDNLNKVMRLAQTSGATAEIRLLREFDDEADAGDVPDPYYGGTRGFEVVQDMVERACRGLLDHIIAEHDL